MKNFIHHSIVSKLVDQTILDESDVHHVFASHDTHEAHMIIVGVVYGRNHAYCYTVAHNLGIHHHDFEERYHEFINCKVCEAKKEVLIRMVLHASYTGTSFRNHLISGHRKKKFNIHGDESHAAHLHDNSHHFDFFTEEEMDHYCHLIRHRFQNGDHYAEVFRLHVEGHSNDEINEELGIKSAHTVKHRVFQFLKSHRQQ